jgi:hypothetical protein
MTGFILRLRQRIRKICLRPNAVATLVSGYGRTIIGEHKFEQRVPSPQNEIDIFAGCWASDLSDVVPGSASGSVKHFTADPRPVYAMKALAGYPTDRRLRVLELGPLEAGHTYQFEKMGVNEIIAIESNVEAFLKCLIVKNLTGLRNAKFLLGDFVEYLKEDTSHYDFIFCCGVLYHMHDPLQLIELMAARTDRIFVWTHYYTEESRPGLPAVAVRHGDEDYIYHRLTYGNRDAGTFWGGNKSIASFLTREDILRAFRQHGFVNFELHHEDLRHPGGPCFSISLWRPSGTPPMRN